ncbi:kinase-like domain-containing protein [Parasitella parasitica]|nr:kinase-like domain-containing protein [Parasitella parasitica]
MLGTFASIERKVIGQGTCVAYKTYSKSHGKLVFQHYKRELWALKRLAVATKEDSVQNHIVQFLDNQESVSSYHLIFPFHKDTLAMRMSSSAKNPSLAYDFLQQISKGLSYMHQLGIIHCDLSPSNILIDDTSGCMLICDFGCAHLDTVINEDSQWVANEEIGTRYYKAPEHLFGSRAYKPATDVWCLGAIFSELLIGYPIFNGESDIEQIGRLVLRLGKPSLQVQTEEMTNYPDANKLIFFDDNDSEIEEDSDQDDGFISIRMPLADLLKKEQISDDNQDIIIRILTWSVKDRLTIPQIHDHLAL